MIASIESRQSWVIASVSLAILAVAFGGPWIAVVALKTIAAEQMLAALDGRPVDRVLNPQVWPRYAARFRETFGFAPENSGGG